MTGRSFRLPAVSKGDVELSYRGFSLEHQRYSAADGAHYFYLRAPEQAGLYTLSAQQGAATHSQSIRVCDLNGLRTPHEYNGEQWPRRWPLGQPWTSSKTRQTLQDLPHTRKANPALDWWLSCDYHALWHGLPPAERPQAHYVNVTQGCPRCGKAIFAHHGFYPWIWPDAGQGAQARCPACGLEASSNALDDGDWHSGPYPDDGFGYVDDNGHIYLFAATHHRNQVIAFGSGIAALTDHIRGAEHSTDDRDRLVLMLLRYAQETLYVATAAQFRYGPSKEREEPWAWGQTDWAAQADPVGALYRKGLLRYSIDVPIIAQTMALAYDTVWPHIQQNNGNWLQRARALGLTMTDGGDGVQLVEEMLAVQLQCLIDGGGLSNFPRSSIGALVLLQALDRSDLEQPLEWLYDRSQERLRTFVSNNFFSDGTPPEATGGYNDTHSMGLFELEENLQRLRTLHPSTYPAERYPSLLSERRAARIACAPHEIVLLGRAILGFGDGASAGVQGPLNDTPYAPMGGRLLERALTQLDDPRVQALRQEPQTHRSLGTTIHDAAGIAVLRTGGTPERAAVGAVYGDAWLHRHMDLLDVQLFAHGQPFLSDLGYPQSWTSVGQWEAHWATHNTGWGVVDGVNPIHWPSDTPFYFLKALAGRGKLRRFAQADGVQIVEVEVERWAWDAERMRWFRPGVSMRRLLALIETDGDSVALVDMIRIHGGQQHWRSCRGLEGTFTGAGHWSEQPGTAAGPTIERGQTDQVSHDDLIALAYMDAVRSYDGPTRWQGQWQSRHDAETRLDIHQLGSNTDMDLLCARSTATLGNPDDSRYCYNGLLWSRCPTPDEPTTRIDLVFEPSVGPAALVEVKAIEGSGQSAGTRLRTHTGRTINLYWNPDSAETVCTFTDGTTLSEGVGWTVDDRHHAAARHFTTRQRSVQDNPPIEGTIIALDRSNCTIDVDGLSAIEPGARVTINPDGRGHTYRVEAVQALSARRFRLALDVDSLLGRGQIRQTDGRQVVLDHFIAARTGNLHSTRLQIQGDEPWAIIEEAINPDAQSTQLWLHAPIPDAEPSTWVEAVDYVVGDRIRYEPTVHA